MSSNRKRNNEALDAGGNVENVIYFENDNFYVKDSFLVTRNGRKSLEKGLFSKTHYKPDDMIGQFKGNILKLHEYNILLEAGVTKPGYGIFIENDYVLDCYMASRKYECLASYANSPYKCINMYTNMVATDNCGLYYNKMCTIACPDVYLVAKSHIAPDDELLCLYGYEEDQKRVI